MTATVCYIAYGSSQVSGSSLIAHYCKSHLLVGLAPPTEHHRCNHPMHVICNILNPINEGALHRGSTCRVDKLQACLPAATWLIFLVSYPGLL